MKIAAAKAAVRFLPVALCTMTVAILAVLSAAGIICFIGPGYGSADTPAASG